MDLSGLKFGLSSLGVQTRSKKKVAAPAVKRARVRAVKKVAPLALGALIRKKVGSVIGTVTKKRRRTTSSLGRKIARWRKRGIYYVRPTKVCARRRGSWKRDWSPPTVAIKIKRKIKKLRYDRQYYHTWRSTK